MCMGTAGTGGGAGTPSATLQTGCSPSDYLAVALRAGMLRAPGLAPVPTPELCTCTLSLCYLCPGPFFPEPPGMGTTYPTAVPRLPLHICSPTLALLPGGLIRMALQALCGGHALQASCTGDTLSPFGHHPNSLGSPVAWKVVSWDLPIVGTACSGPGACRWCPYAPCAPAHQPHSPASWRTVCCLAARSTSGLGKPVNLSAAQWAAVRSEPPSWGGGTLPRLSFLGYSPSALRHLFRILFTSLYSFAIIFAITL